MATILMLASKSLLTITVLEAWTPPAQHGKRF
jgi:hypothetical protein